MTAALKKNLTRKLGKNLTKKQRKRKLNARLEKDRCKLFKRAGRLTRAAKAGPVRTKFSGRIGKKEALMAGRYRLSITATDAAGNASKTRRARFTVVKEKARKKAMT